MGPSPKPAFELTRECFADGAHWIRITGELDIATADRLSSALAEIAGAGGGELVFLDLTACSFIDSTGLAMILRCARELESRLYVICPNRRIRWLFELTGIDQTVSLHTDLAGARAAADGA
jgi:anti-anti-sigma factor